MKIMTAPSKIWNVAAVLLITAIARVSKPDDTYQVLYPYENCAAAWSLSALNPEERGFVWRMCQSDVDVGNLNNRTRRDLGERLQKISLRLLGVDKNQLVTYLRLMPPDLLKKLITPEEVDAISEDIPEEEKQGKALEKLKETQKLLNGIEKVKSDCLLQFTEQKGFMDQIEIWSKPLQIQTQTSLIFNAFSINKPNEKGKDKKDQCAPLDPHALTQSPFSSPAPTGYSYAFVFALSNKKSHKPKVYSGDLLRAMPLSNEAVPVNDMYLYVTVLKSNSPYVVLVPSLAATIPYSFVGFNDGSTETMSPIQDYPDKRTRCVDLDIATDENSVVLLDGNYLTDDLGPMAVPIQDHRITVMTQEKITVMTQEKNPRPVQYAIKYEKDIRKAELEDLKNECYSVRMDLRSSKTITLTPVSIEGTCGDSAASPGKLWGDAATFLTENKDRTKKRFRDLRAVAQMSEYLAGLQTALINGASGGVGASRGPAATESLMAEAAAELWRQGVGRIISLELQCPPTISANFLTNRRETEKTGPVRYSLIGRSINVEALYSQTKDRIKGASLEQLVTLQTETVDESPQLEQAMKRVISRLMQLPYIRFITNRQDRQFHERIDVFLEYVMGSEDKSELIPNLDAYYFDDYGESASCDLLERSGKIAGRPPTETVLGDKAAVTDSVNNTKNVNGKDDRVKTVQYEVRPQRTGTILLMATLKNVKNEPIDTAFRCISISRKKGTIWGRFSVGLLGMLQNERTNRNRYPFSAQYRSTYYAVQIGAGLYTHSNIRRSSGLFSGYLGFSKATNMLDGPLSWDDYPQEDINSNTRWESNFDTDGAIPLNWTRTNISIGIDAMNGSSICRVFRKLNCNSIFRRLDYSLSVEAGLDVGIINLSRTTKKYLEYAGEEYRNHSTDLDLSLRAYLGLGLHATFRMYSQLIIGVQFNGLDDGLARWVSKEDARIMILSQALEYDFSTILNFGIRVGYDL